MRESSFPLSPNFEKVEKRRFEFYNISVIKRRTENEEADTGRNRKTHQRGGDVA